MTPRKQKNSSKNKGRHSRKNNSSIALNKQKSRDKSKKSKNNELSSLKNKHIPFLNNVLVAIFLVAIVFRLVEVNVGYKWVHETLIKANLKTIRKYKNLTFEQKQEVKMGFNARYLNFVKSNTPDTAIILMPPDHVIFPPKGKSDFNKYMKSKSWCAYFLYPRRIIYAREQESSVLYGEATHIAIINGWGYHLLPYQISNENKYSVIPLKK